MWDEVILQYFYVTFLKIAKTGLQVLLFYNTQKDEVK